MACLIPPSVGDHSSDMQLAVSQLQQNNQLIGYRNLLSYTTSLGISSIRRSALSQEEWKLRAQGQYSAVYGAVMVNGDQAVEKVIIKKPNASFTRDSADIESALQHKALIGIIQELRILAHQDLRAHPNLPRILGLFFEDARDPDGTIPCLVLEQAVSDLAAYLGNNHLGSTTTNNIPATAITSFSSDIAAGLAAIHGHGLVHGDLKPSNILLFHRDSRLTAALADFTTCGIADQSPQNVGIIPGTAGFWAPEYYRDSPYHAWVNSPPRDIYGFGLVILSMMGSCQTPPFPENSITLQHDDKKCLDHLRACVLLPDAEFLWRIVEHCFPAKPEKRWSLAQIASALRNVQGFDSTFRQIQIHAEQALLKDPDNPRVAMLHQIELSPHLHSKLISEYAIAAKESVDVRLAVTMAALYSGAVGVALEAPYNFVAKAQWLLKAVELGSFPAVHALFEDRNTRKLIESLGESLLSHKPLTFYSPNISTEPLIEQLRAFATLPDVESLNMLVFLGGEIPLTLSIDAEHQFSKPRSSMQEKVRERFPGIYDLEDRESLLELDLQILDSDAYDLAFSQKEEMFVLAYTDDLEAMMRQPDTTIVPSLPELLCTAILGGSVRTVRYLVSNYELDPNSTIPEDSVVVNQPPNMADQATSQDEPEAEENSDSDFTDYNESDNIPDLDEEENYNLSFLDLAIILGRRAIVAALLERGGRIHAAEERQPSSLHYLARFDDEELAKMTCQSVPDRQLFKQIVQSTSSQGKLEGVSAIEWNIFAGRWKNVLQIILQSPPQTPEDSSSSSQGESNLLYMALSRSPPAPLFIIEEILARGANPNIAASAAEPPLYWTIGSSNVAATEMLLRYGASLRPIGGPDLVSFAKECLDEIDMYSNIIVVNQEGVLRPEGLKEVKQATATIYAMVFIASEADHSWLQDLAVCMSQCPEACLGKIWRADRSEPSETTMLLELSITT
ncbi:serine/threonine protein kinase [Microdochium nivale]|nr:serine/threonine protein kinase [Microdochium nivale]